MAKNARQAARPTRTVQEDAIKAFLSNLPDDSEEYAELWAKEWATFADKAVTTRNIYTSRYRQAARDALGDSHPILNYIKVLDRSDDPERAAESRSASGGGRRPMRVDRIAAFGDLAQAVKDARREALNQGRTAKQTEGPYKRAIEKLWKVELDDMLATLKGSTILSTTSAYRKELRRRGMDDELTLSLVRAPDEVQKAITTQYRESIVERHRDLVAMPKWREILDRAIELLPSTDASWMSLDEKAREAAEDVSRERATEIGLGLTLVTGRRPFEVFCQGVFAPLPLVIEPTVHQGFGVKKAYETWRVLFSGQAKTRGNVGTNFDLPFTIPVLTKARDVMFSWLVLRYSESGQAWSRMTNEEFKNDLLRIPNPKAVLPPTRERVLKPLWPQIEKDDSPNVVEAKRIKAHNIRSLYAEIADQFFRPKSQSKASFFSEILGHTEKDIETASSYMKYYLPDKKDAGPTKRVKGRLAGKIEAAAEERENRHEQADEQSNE